MTRSVAEKMHVKPGERAYFLRAPMATIDLLGLPDLECSKVLRGKFDLLIAFFRSQEEMRADFPRLKAHLRPGGKLWACWQKGIRQDTGLSLPKVIEIGYDFGLVESTTLSVDESWSGMKFTFPKPGQTYANSYGKLSG